MRRSAWSLVLLWAAAFGCSGENLGDPFAEVDGGDGSSGSSGVPSGAGGVFAGGFPGASIPGQLCMSRTLESGRLAPDILIVLDRSLSMQAENRWAPSVMAVQQITSELQSRVGFGLMTFPGTSGGGGGGRGGQGQDLTCAPGTLNVPIGSNTAGMIANALNNMRPGGATPTAVTLAAAREEIEKLSVDPDAMPRPKYVLLVTDGAPNCTDGLPPSGGMQTATGSLEPAQVDASITEIKALAKAGVKTYVLGYDTQNEATLKGALDRMAQAGATGDKEHRAVESQQTLVDQLRKITDLAITCDFELDGAVRDSSYVLVKLDGKQLNLGDDDGWTLSKDRKVVTVQGKSCDLLKQDGHRITVSVECEQVGWVE
jgi:Mg-chelatase subunit ChlD